jgi:hypothetical protein
VEFRVARHSPSGSGPAAAAIPSCSREQALAAPLDLGALVAAPTDLWAVARADGPGSAATGFSGSCEVDLGRWRMLLVRARIRAYLHEAYHYAPVYYVMYLVNLGHFI